MTKCVTFRFPCVARVCITVAPGYHGGPVVASAKLSVIEWISSCRSERNRLHEVQALIASGLLHACAMIGIVVFAVGQPHRVARSDFVGLHGVPIALESVVTSLPEAELSNHSADFNLGIGRKEPLAASIDSNRAKVATQAHPETTSDVSSEKTTEPLPGPETPALLNDSQNALAEPLVGSNSTQVAPIQDVNRNGNGNGVSLGTAQVASSRESRSSRDAAGSTGAAVSDSDAGLFGAIRGAIQRQVRYPSAARFTLRQMP